MLSGGKHAARKLKRAQILLAADKQRSVLASLAMFDCYMSASEIADEELRELVRHQLARYSVEPGIDGRLSWGATDAGRASSRQIKRGVL